MGDRVKFHIVNFHGPMCVLGGGGGGRLVKQIYAFTGCGRGVVLLGFEIVKFGFQGVLNCLVGVSIVFK